MKTSSKPTKYYTNTEYRADKTWALLTKQEAQLNYTITNKQTTNSYDNKTNSLTRHITFTCRRNAKQLELDYTRRA